MKNLTLIIPAKHESESLPLFINQLKNYDCKILVVTSKDDLDTSRSINENENTKIIFQENDGYGNALIEGINKSETEYSCIINADGSMDPKYLPDMLSKCKNNDLIFASRYERPEGGSDDDTMVTYIGNSSIVK